MFEIQVSDKPKSIQLVLTRQDVRTELPALWLRARSSCSSQRAPAQPAWDAVLAREPPPDAFVWLGDIVYADKPIL